MKRSTVIITSIIIAVATLTILAGLSFVYKDEPELIKKSSSNNTLLYGGIAGNEEYLPQEMQPLINITSIGESQEISFEIDNGIIAYNESKNYALIGYEQVWYDETEIIQQCNYTNKDPNVTIDCWNISHINRKLNESANGNRILQELSITKITYDKYAYLFTDKSCWICGTYIACLSNEDGGTGVKYRASEYKCDMNDYPIIRHGESGYIYNLTTNKEIYYRSDVTSISRPEAKKTEAIGEGI